MQTIERKRCAKCKDEKDVSEFHRSRQTKDGCHPYCKSCKLGVEKILYRRDITKRREYARNYHKKNPEKKREHSVSCTGSVWPTTTRC
jgi:hypothetical protein